jgi:hypothetical protein
MTLRRLRRIFDAAGASLVVEVRWRGGDLDRLRDEDHASLAAAFAARARALGWTVEPEVTYSEYGERGSIDLLCVEATGRGCIVVEVKSSLISVEATLRKLDEKVRLAPALVVRRAGWRPTAVARVLVLPDDTTARRRVARHRSLLDSTLPGRAGDIRIWMRAPGRAFGGIWFLPPTHSMRGGESPTSRQRVRRRRIEAA